MLTLISLINSDETSLLQYDNVVIPDKTRKMLLSLGAYVYVVFEALVQNAVNGTSISVTKLTRQLGLSKTIVNEAIKILGQYNWYHVNDSYTAVGNPNDNMAYACIGYNAVALYKGLPLKPEYNLQGMFIHQDYEEEDFNNYEE